MNFLSLTQELAGQFRNESKALLSTPAALSSRAVEELRLAYLGKRGRVTALFEGMRDVTKEDRPAAGKAVNDLRQMIEAELDALKSAADQREIASLVDERRLDISLPVSTNTGSLHPVSLMRKLLLREFRQLGFTVYDGPEIDGDFYNFSALNFPDEHPARDMQDTFFVEDFPRTVLRTHTSNIEIHAMLAEKPPIRIVAPGRTFRCDSDPTHTPMFHQIEALVVDRHISFANMKGVIDHFLKAVYGPTVKTRLRPSFFPFVEPGAEVDMQCVSCQGKGCRLCKMTGWLEIGGCGMTHPNVFEAVGIDSEEWSGFAFGFGIDRMAMLKYGLSDLRTLFSGDNRFLSQFPAQV